MLAYFFCLTPYFLEAILKLLAIGYYAIFFTDTAMFFGDSPEQTRQFFFDAWRKFQSKQPLTSLETQVAAVINSHPEYQALLSNSENSAKSFFPELGDENPFLHMGLHLALREQIASNRPEGIKTVYDKLCKKYGELETEHRMMDCLAQALWQAQRNNAMPDEQKYLQHLQQVL